MAFIHAVKKTFFLECVAVMLYHTAHDEGVFSGNTNPDGDALRGRLRLQIS
jgi:hypothetical protein